MALSKQQQAAVWVAARPLDWRDRQAFLEAIASELNGRAEVGDGELNRIIRRLQWRFLVSPSLASEPGVFAPLASDGHFVAEPATILTRNL